MQTTSPDPLLSLFLDTQTQTPRVWEDVRSDVRRDRGLCARLRATSPALKADSVEEKLRQALLRDAVPHLLGAPPSALHLETRALLSQTLPASYQAVLSMCQVHAGSLEDAREAHERLTALLQNPETRKARKSYRRLCYEAGKQVRLLQRFGWDPKFHEVLGRALTEHERAYLGAQTAWKALPVSGHSQRLRVLVLHPFRQSSARMKARSRAALRGLEDLVEFVYLDAPNAYQPDEATRDALLQDMGALPDYAAQRCWWNTNERGDAYQGWEASVELVRRHLPADGILGVSQGAALAGLVSHLEPERVGFVMCVSGFVPRTHDDEMMSGSVDVPSFHLYGERDTLIAPERTQALASCFQRATVHSHSGGHFAPGRWPLDEMRAFLLQFATAPQPALLHEPSWETWLTHGGERPALPLEVEACRNLLASTQALGPRHRETAAQLWMDVWEVYPEGVLAQVSTSTSWPLLGEVAIALCNAPEVVEAIAQKFATQLREDEDGGDVTDVALYAPRQRSRAERVAGLASSITKVLWPTSPGRTGLARYRRLVVELSKQWRDAQKRERASMRGQDVFAPISDAVLRPRPEPVTPCPVEELTPLLHHLEMGRAVEQDAEFARGTVTPDGRLDLCKQVVGPQGISPLLRALEEHPHVNTLLLGNNVVGAPGAQAITSFLESGRSKLKVWYIAGNELTATDVKPIAKALAHAPEVEGLWLKRNPLGPEGGAVIATLLREAPHLHTLDLVNTGLLDDGVLEILEALLENTTLRHLFLGTNGLTAKSAQRLGDVLSQHRGLRSVYLGCNRLGNEGAQVLADALSKNTHLQRLGLDSNRIGVPGVTALAEALKGHPSLRFLNLGWGRATHAVGEMGNHLGVRGAQALSELILSSPSLEGLDVSHCQIPQAGLNLLSDAVESSGRLTYLRCPQFGHELQPVAMATLRRRVQRNREAQGVDANAAAHVRLPDAARDVLSVYRTEPIIP